METKLSGPGIKEQNNVHKTSLAAFSKWVHKTGFKEKDGILEHGGIWKFHHNKTQNLLTRRWRKIPTVLRLIWTHLVVTVSTEYCHIKHMDPNLELDNLIYKNSLKRKNIKSKTWVKLKCTENKTSLDALCQWWSHCEREKSRAAISWRNQQHRRSILMLTHLIIYPRKCFNCNVINELLGAELLLLPVVAFFTDAEEVPTSKPQKKQPQQKHQRAIMPKLHDVKVKKAKQNRLKL